MITDDSFSRKRSRSPGPPIMREEAPPSAVSASDLQYLSGLQDPVLRNATLNQLLQVSASHEISYSLSSDHVLLELVHIATHDCLEWHEPPDNKDEQPVFRARECWLTPPTARMQAWVQHCQEKLDPKYGSLSSDKMRMLQVILVILRNFSYVGANHRLMAYSPPVLSLLLGCLYEGCDPTRSSNSGTDASSSSSSAVMTLASSALQVFLHLAPHMDVSGQKLVTDKLFYRPQHATDGPPVPDASTFGQTAMGNWGFGSVWLAKRLDVREDTMANANKAFVLSLTADQLVCVWSLFAGITHRLTDPKSPRSLLLLTLDLLQEAINSARVAIVGSVQLDDDDTQLPTIRAILVSMPDAVLERLSDCLCVPRAGPDALDYVDPVHHVVTRVVALKLRADYDATVDTELRDRALDVLVPLQELDSPRMAARLGHQPDGSIRTRLLDAVYPILTTQAGRNEATVLASQLLRELCKAEENRVGFLYLQDRLVELASRDSRVSQLVWNDLYPLSDDSSPEEMLVSDKED